MGLSGSPSSPAGYAKGKEERGCLKEGSTGTLFLYKRFTNWRRPIRSLGFLREFARYRLLEPRRFP